MVWQKLSESEVGDNDVTVTVCDGRCRLPAEQRHETHVNRPSTHCVMLTTNMMIMSKVCHLYCLSALT